jgi:NhaP-type Na+/H+ or K+/H+ antiporter
MTMQLDSINRSDLHRRLARVAQLRSVLTMLSALGTMILLGAILPGVPQNAAVLVVLVYFGVPLLVCWIVTVLICRRLVTCPYCPNSLWSCGSGNFKPRRMKVRDEVSRCPHCGVPIL